MIYWFFGYPGIGKDYLAKKFGKINRIHYINGDTLLLKKEQKKIKAGTFTIRDRLKKLSRITKHLKKIKKDLVITDSLPDNKSRKFLLTAFKKNIIFIHVTASKEKHIKYLRHRKGHFFTEKMLPHYIQNWEQPQSDFPHVVLKNKEKIRLNKFINS